MHLHFYSLLKLANPCVHTANVVKSPGFTVRQVTMTRNTNQTHLMNSSLLTNQEKQKVVFLLLLALTLSWPAPDLSHDDAEPCPYSQDLSMHCLHRR